MKTEPASRSAALRLAFDTSFVLPPAPRDDDEVDLIAIRVGAVPHAIRVAEIGGIVARRPITAVPSDAPGLVGLAGIRGDVVPVYRLSFFLGEHDAPPAAPWLVLDRAADPLALAVDVVDGHLVRVARRAVRPHAHPERAHPLSTDVAETAHGLLPVIDVPSVFAAIRAPSPARAPTHGETQRSEGR